MKTHLQIQATNDLKASEVPIHSTLQKLIVAAPRQQFIQQGKILMDFT